MTRPILMASVILCLWSVSAPAQWIKNPTSGIPRTGDGKADLTAPPPRSGDGKPDLSGVWQFNTSLAYTANIAADLAPHEIMPWADNLFRGRIAEFGKDDPSNIGCLPRGPRQIVGSTVISIYAKVIQTSGLITILYEDLTYRQIFTDGRELPRDPNPSFMGYSVGRWEGDTLVVETTGFNDRTWLDFGGHPHTEALRITERFRRVNIGRIDLQVTLEDRGAYARPWTVPVNVELAADTDLIEYVCNETQDRWTHLGRSEAERSLVVAPETLSEYVGTYSFDPAVTTRSLFNVLTVRIRDGMLYCDLDGKGNIPLIPLSQTSFSIRLVNVEFVRNERGQVAHAVVLQTGSRYIRTR
jgi:hypothetical protein